MDLEGYAKEFLKKGENEIDTKNKLVDRILEIKTISRVKAKQIAEAILIEAKTTLNVEGDVLTSTLSGVCMGEFGVGSRGKGDFHVHEQIAEIIGKTNAVIDSSHLDDAGVMKLDDGKYILMTVDGMHSRLSDFPFLAGFHDARAALRDIYVMGSHPIALFSDIHVADDGDVAKIFDHIAGITAISKLTGVPLITGSTLRIGGDVVIGTRMSGCVGALGVAANLTPRKFAQEGDVILMTEGSGGATISTTALYNGMHEVVNETLNVKFFDACRSLINSNLISKIHAMTDITNGGIRGDASEISKIAGVKLVFDDNKLRRLVNDRVLEMLEKLEIDYLGVSLDALLIIARPEYANEIIECIRKQDVEIDIVGRVEEGKGVEIIINDDVHDLTPRFRESAYTPIKKVIGENTPEDFDYMKSQINYAAKMSIEKRERVIEQIRDKISSYKN
ncbi:hypothetical protein METP2_02936 [Methanosarcinales archaeon]|uniref:AIR synthase-related protein n=1 Tax=Candidatus Methanoperedens sp. BLZ2 TaxID=2035255 RepID=UPI000BE34909|nr:AIR synthase-related protein [Candidatus Methanoperedens sp. BLZ2]KAB2947460.1 MAG: hypothetical protein F9K14_03325 [Candidatus Methanoperedens sp.]MBZ0175173.1 hypothetical protein [Candidatus Methanoperedens nitroreducens]CAG0996296.1 hypothetical protein METP2_02936 [Methanosarcinales archaeon]MCX9078736.1 AIR synthase-related protein [Candidatus Methanoperedens sp.]MCX9086514.1 AIR synthase-related protein [Candidatus Methanoperedens sp.]